MYKYNVAIVSQNTFILDLYYFLKTQRIFNVPKKWELSLAVVCSPSFTHDWFPFLTSLKYYQHAVFLCCLVHFSSGNFYLFFSFTCHFSFFPRILTLFPDWSLCFQFPLMFSLLYSWYKNVHRNQIPSFCLSRFLKLSVHLKFKTI